MKTRTAAAHILLLLLLPFSPTLAQDQPPPSLEGIWRWTFTMPDGSQTTPRLEIKEEDGKLIGSTRFRPGSDTPVTNLTFTSGEVGFEVVREREGRVVVTRYSGILNSNTIKGKIVSNWAGDDQTYDWEARRSTGPNGAWKWATGYGGARAEFTLTLKQEGDKLTGKITPPRGDADLKHGRIKNNEITFQTERERDGETFTNRYSGKLSGNRIRGRIESNSSGQPRTNGWEAVRAD